MSTTRTIGLTIAQAFAIGERYTALGKVLTTPALPTSMKDTAREELQTLASVEYAVETPCLLCKGTFHHYTSVADMARWIDRPRGLCGTCANGKFEGTATS